MYRRAPKPALDRIHGPQLQEVQVQQWRPSAAPPTRKKSLYWGDTPKPSEERGSCGAYKRRDYQGESIKSNQSRWEHPSQKTARVMFPRQTDRLMYVFEDFEGKKKFIAEDEFRVKWLAHRTLREKELLIQRRIWSITPPPPKKETHRYTEHTSDYQ